MGTISPYGLGTCRNCRRTVRWATTEAGKAQPLNPEPDSEGNVAARLGEGPGWWARVPTPERPQTAMERRFMPHAATCPATRPTTAPQPPPSPATAPTPPDLPPGVASLTDYRRNKEATP